MSLPEDMMKAVRANLKREPKYKVGDMVRVCIGSDDLWDCDGLWDYTHWRGKIVEVVGAYFTPIMGREIYKLNLDGQILELDRYYLDHRYKNKAV